jgi:hypothetical protein
MTHKSRVEQRFVKFEGRARLPEKLAAMSDVQQCRTLLIVPIHTTGKRKMPSL